MKKLTCLILAVAWLPNLARAIYAPIPELEQGKALTIRVGGSLYYDNNIFGAAYNALDSMVFNLSGKIAFNGSLSDQTFASASYFLSNDYVEDRPGDKNLTNQSVAGRIAHSFSEVSNIDISVAYDIVMNPESLEAGFPTNTDQSYDRAQADARYTTAFGQKAGFVAKYRFIDYSYENADIATQLDHAENLAGLELSYSLHPQTKLIGEYRYQVISYDNSGAMRDKTSNFLMGGFDYNPGDQLLIAFRGGIEDRERDAQPDTTAPYVEASARYTYAQDSFFSGGYTYAIEEPSDIIRFNDSEVSRFFANLQHRLTGTITASGSLTYELAELQARSPYTNIDETVLRFGLGLSWQPTKNWTVSATFDIDEIDSDDPDREQSRDRGGVSASYTF
jgi:hypothetical protein